MIYLEQIRESRWFKPGLQAAAGVAAVVVLIVIVWAWFGWQQSRGLTALAAASQLAQQVDKPDTPPGTRERAIQALEVVIADYPRMAAMPQAAYQLGNLKYSAGQYAAARAAYELALAKGASGALRTMAGMGIGYAWEAEKNYSAAAQAHAAAVKGLRPTDFLYEEAMMAQARDQALAGNPAAGVEIYERLLRELPRSAHADDLRNRVASLKSRPGQ